MRYKAFIITGSLFFCMQTGHAMDAELERKKVESSIKSELSQELSRVIPEGQYLLFVTVQGFRESSAEPAPLTKPSPKPLQKPDRVEQNFLPGFVPLAEEPPSEVLPPAPLPTPSEEESSKKWKRYNVTNVNVDILHPSGIDSLMVSSLHRLITDRLQALHPNALVQVRFERMNPPPTKEVAEQTPSPGPQPLFLREEPTKPRTNEVAKVSPADELASFLVRNFFPVVFFLLLGLGLFLLTIILLFLLWSRSNTGGDKGDKIIVKNIRPREQSPRFHKTWTSPPLSAESSPPKVNSVLSSNKTKEKLFEKTEEEIQEMRDEADRCEADFSKNFSQEPLVARRYVQELLSVDKDLLLSTLNSTVFRGAIANLMGLEKQEGIGWKNLLKNLLPEDQVQKRLEILKRQTKDLRAYQDLMRTQMGDGSLGKLSFLSSEELERVLSDLDGTDVAQVLRHVRPELLRDFTRNMSETQRKSLLSFGLEERNILSDERKELLAKKLSNRVEEIEKTIFTSKTSKDQIFKCLLETSQDRRTLLEDMRRKDENLYRKYEHYGVGLDDFFRERDTGLINLVLESLENEDMVIICLNLPSRDREKLMSLLPPTRKSLVQSMVYASGSAGTDEQAFENSREKLVQAYRARRKMKV